MPADADFIILDARIDLKNWNKAIDQMQADARGIESRTILVGVKVDDSGLRGIQGQLDKIDTDIKADVKFQVTGDDITKLRDEWDDPLLAKIKFSQTGDDIVGLRDAFDDTINADVKFNQTGDDILSMLDDLDDVTVDVKATEDSSVDTTLKSVEGKLEDLKTLAKIELILNAAEFIKGVEALPLIGALVEIEELSHKVVGQTGRDLENVGRTINNVWTGNWGESKEEIAGVVTQVAQMRDVNGGFLVDAQNIESVVIGAYQAAAVGGVEATETLRTASQLVKNGLSPDLQDAFDFIASGFAMGFNSSDDFLDTVTEYSVTFQDAKLGAQGLFNIIKSGTETGVFNTDKMGDAFKEMFNLTKEEWAIYERNADDATDRTRAIEELGLADEAAAFTEGELAGDAFAQAVIDALNEKFEDPANQQRLAKAIFSPTMVEDAGLANLLQTDLTETNIWAGQAQILSDEIFSGPGSAFQTMQRTLETHFLNALMNSVEAQEFMDKITAAAQRFGSELTSGATIGEALEVALEMPGLNGQIAQLESTLGNFIIDFIQALANVGEALGADVSGLREAVSRYGAGQLSFDLKNATDEGEITAAIQRAVDRGVSGAETTQAISTAVTEMLDQGNITRAQELINNLSQLPEVDLGEKATAVLDAAGGNVDVALEALTKVRDDLASNTLLAGTLSGQAQLAELNTAIAELQGKFTEVDTETLQAQVSTYIQALTNQMQDAITSGDFNLAKTIGEQLGIQNIGQFIGEQKAQTTIDALFPKPTQADLDQYLADNFIGLQNALLEGDYSGAAGFAEHLMDADNPSVQAAIDDFATTLMIQFNNSLAAGDTEAAEDILTLMGLSPETNQVILDSMSQRLADFSTDGTYYIDEFGNHVSTMGEQVESSGIKGETGINKIYDSVLSDKGVLGITRLDSLAKRFDAVAEAITSALSQIDTAEDQLGEGAIEGAAVGGIRGAGVTMVGEAGRELVFSDERFAVLNNQTTERLYTALAGMAGSTTHTNNQRTVNYAPTIYVQNPAQAALFGGQSLNQLRGEAF